MAVILSLETSASVCSTSLSSDGFILFHREEWEGQNHAARLSGFIAESLTYLKEHSLKLNAVAVSMGPGSYTGLRIGLSEAKGLAYALKIPLIGVDTLELLVTRVMFSGVELPEDSLYAPMIDARRMEVFTGLYDASLRAEVAPGPVVLTPEYLHEELERGHIAFFGSGAEKASEIIQNPNALFISGVIPLATDMLALAEKAWMEKNFLNLAYSVPYYLKEFYSSAKH